MQCTVILHVNRLKASNGPMLKVLKGHKIYLTVSSKHSLGN